jgi:FixJ family two-component response regulator
MSRIAAPIWLSDQERITLQTWARARSEAQRVVQRAQIILLAADGIENQEIAQRLRVSRPTVQLWRERFLALRTEGLQKDAVRVAFPRLPTTRSPRLWRPHCTANRPTQRTGARA